LFCLFVLLLFFIFLLGGILILLHLLSGLRAAPSTTPATWTMPNSKAIVARSLVFPCRTGVWELFMCSQADNSDLVR
jgi:hypothetical protein